MNLKSIFQHVGGFFGGALPVFLKIGEVVDLIAKLVRIGANNEDVTRINAACDALDSLAINLSDMAYETHELAAVLRAAIDDDGDAGSDITGAEILAIIDEARDLPAELDQIRTDLTKLAATVRAAL